MVEDATYLAIFHEIAQELEANIIEYNKQTSGVTGKDQLIALRMEQQSILMELLKKHRRAMDHMQGKPVEPETHFGEAILLPAGGFGG
jgi:hypothetical protein